MANKCFPCVLPEPTLHDTLVQCIGSAALQPPFLSAAGLTSNEYNTAKARSGNRRVFEEEFGWELLMTRQTII